MGTTDKQRRRYIKALRNIRHDDPKTWPKEMHDRLAQLDGLADSDNMVSHGLGQLRETLLLEAVLIRCRVNNARENLLFQALFETVEKDSLQRMIVFALEEAISAVTIDVINACQDLVPKLTQALPFETTGEVLKAIGSPRAESPAAQDV